MTTCLSLTPTNKSSQTYSILLSTETPVILGRRLETHTDPSYININSKVISRNHLSVTMMDNQVYIQDIGSSGGTFLNHQRLSPPKVHSKLMQLHSFDLLQFGEECEFNGLYYCAETFSVSINSQTGTHQPLPVTLSSSQLHEQHKQHKQYEQHEQHKQHEQHEQNRQHEQHKQSKQHNHLERVKEIWQSIELKTNAEPLIQKLLADINGTFNQTQIKDTINPSTPSKLTRSLSVIQRSKTIVKGLLVDDGCLVYDESEYIMIELQGKLNDAQKSSGVDKQLKNTDESHHTKKGEESKSSFSNDVLLKGDDKSKCMSNVDAVKKQPIKRYSPVV